MVCDFHIKSVVYKHKCQTSVAFFYQFSLCSNSHSSCTVRDRSCVVFFIFSRIVTRKEKKMSRVLPTDDRRWTMKLSFTKRNTRQSSKTIPTRKLSIPILEKSKTSVAQKSSNPTQVCIQRTCGKYCREINKFWMFILLLLLLFYCLLYGIKIKFNLATQR